MDAWHSSNNLNTPNNNRPTNYNQGNYSPYNSGVFGGLLNNNINNLRNPNY